MVKLIGNATEAIVAGGLAITIAGDRIILKIYNFSCFENVLNVLNEIYIVLL